ncbi:hypothetical protein F7725_010910 [Dissostichus mawsoni]|uniref:trypsin n=1 Tax=Dissostichus mawsoni TaxID=36200 RepID=A0A7J5Z9I7_DISMA|nr:hypothetical protein F7725_010910 [Dissostichus mawsoni]
MDGLLPWMVGGEWEKGGESLAGAIRLRGVLIAESWVLTAAHCLDNSMRFRVRLGDYERHRVEGTEVNLKVLQAFKHPNYNTRTYDNDIALLRLETPAPFSKFILPACLPSSDLAERVLHLNGTPTVVSGWGKEEMNSSTFSSALNVINIPVVERDLCTQHMSNTITENVLCAGVLGQRQDACEGDSGGPMVTLYRDTWFLLGLVSWGEGCGRQDKLGIYTKVSNYNQWIQGIRDDWDRRVIG